MEVVRRQTSGTKASILYQFDNYFKNAKLKTNITINNQYFPKGSLVHNVAGGLFIQRKSEKNPYSNCITHSGPYMDYILFSLNGIKLKTTSTRQLQKAIQEKYPEKKILLDKVQGSIIIVNDNNSNRGVRISLSKTFAGFFNVNSVATNSNWSHHDSTWEHSYHRGFDLTKVLEFIEN